MSTQVFSQVRSEQQISSRVMHIQGYNAAFPSMKASKAWRSGKLVIMGRISPGRCMVLLFLACFHLRFAKNDTPLLLILAFVTHPLLSIPRHTSFHSFK